jgi:hypothetical protein
MNVAKSTNIEQLKERLLYCLLLYNQFNQWQYHKEVLEICARLYELSEDKLWHLKK